MFYVDSQRTLTRRDSSLLLPLKRFEDEDRPEYDFPTSRHSTALRSESTVAAMMRPWGSVQKEVVTSLFETMLGCIVETWEVVSPMKVEESPHVNVGKTASETTFTSKKKKTGSASATLPKTKSQKSRSKMDVIESTVKQVNIEPLLQVWWSSPDEKAVIRFKNGNLYEGNISMKSMNGEGRFQWADGTVYLGHFNDNEMTKGLLHWKDDTWYEGDFVGNVRHGKGLYVDSQTQRYYAGNWHCGTKHGKGVIGYSNNNTYDGDWIYNVRHGYGIREYCPWSGYKGGWDLYLRHGEGTMIWPNHDFYTGEWKDGVMHGSGMYVWDAYYNNSMSLPSLNIYRGNWNRGARNGYGVLNLGLGLGSRYDGNFTDNKKNGKGVFVSNNGLILCDNNLFRLDALGPIKEQDIDQKLILPSIDEPYEFNICDDTVGLMYHAEEALDNFDRQEEIRTQIIKNFFNNNNISYKRHTLSICEIDPNVNPKSQEQQLQEFMKSEEIGIRKALRCYEIDLKMIYYDYATVCNTKPITFTPVMIRLYMWQFYYDLNVHSKGLTLVQIDRLFHSNSNWLSKSPHDPFEKIYFWQFLHNLIAVSRLLYAERHLPGPKPDTILGKAFTAFMESDVLPGVHTRRGRLSHGFGSFVPLRGLYALYCNLGEPHTVRKFLCAVHRHSYDTEEQPLELIEASDESISLGHNVYIYGDQISFVNDDKVQTPAVNENENTNGLPLFNFGNLSCKTIIDIFAKIFLQVCQDDVIMDLDVEMNFFEFFEAFIACAEESIRVKDEEIRWREEFCNNLTMLTTGIRNVEHGRPSSALRPDHAANISKIRQSSGRQTHIGHVSKLK